MLDFDSFSNFWFVVDENLHISKFSHSFDKSLIAGSSLLDSVKFTQPRIKNDRLLYDQVQGMVINLSIPSLPYPFRATAHLNGEEVLFLCWPFLTKIEDMQTFGLATLMKHPACMITDILIFKDVLFKQQAKIKKLELEQIEKKLADQIRINRHQAKLASIGILAAGIGHEINNPLAIISGNLELLQLHLNSHYNSDPFAEKQIKKMERSIERIVAIIKGLRSLSRTDESEFKNFSLSELVTETENMIQGIFQREGILLVTRVEPEIYVFGSRGRIQQVLINLLTNAKDALENRDVKEISLSCKTSSGNVVISVKDTGVGVPKEFQSKIFEPFFTTKDVNKGTGIGLALIHSIVKEHGGDVHLESEVGVGSTFSVVLPTVRDLKTEAPSMEKQGKLEKIFSGTVLIVDDEEEILEVLKHIFESFGVKVLTASNGVEGIEVLNANLQNVDILISDMKMPLLDGPGFFKKVKETSYQGDFYFISGGVNIDFSILAGEVNGILQKPFKKQEIYDILLRCFN
jgi:signal transduction histidine kinase/CheY-like chemotaxis protein